MPIVTDVPLTLRIPKGSPLTAQEHDNNFVSLKNAILALSGTLQEGRVIISDTEPSDHDQVLWIKPDGSGAFVWNNTLNKWVRVVEPTLYGEATGVDGNYDLTLPEIFANYTELKGKLIAFRVNHDNPNSTPTLRVNELEPRQDIRIRGSEDVPVGGMEGGATAVVIHDGTRFQLLNPVPLDAPEIQVVSDPLDIPLAGETGGPAPIYHREWTHPFQGTVPRRVTWVMRYKAGKPDWEGYRALDSVNAEGIGLGDPQAFTFWANAQQVGFVRIASRGLNLTFYNKITGGLVGLTDTLVLDWEMLAVIDK